MKVPVGKILKRKSEIVMCVKNVFVLERSNYFISYLHLEQ